MEEKGNKKGEVNVTKNTKYKRSEVRWSDINSDDEDTVVLQNHGKQQDENKWEVVKNKKSEKQNKKINMSEKNEKIENKELIKNPYLKTANTKHIDKRENVATTHVQSSLASYAEMIKNKKRDPNENSIRVNFSLTPRTTGPEELKRIARELLGYANEMEHNVMLLPWVDSDIHSPIALDDLVNPCSMMNTISLYFDKPSRAAWQVGVPVYGVGVRFSTNQEREKFIDTWNMKKREYKATDRVAYNINMAPTQNSPRSFIIGMAVGSTENQDLKLLNKRLEESTGIKGIEASFQNINQYGVTAEFWKIANANALKANKDKTSRDHLRTKYRWAPNAIALFVPTKEVEGIARKIMLHKYGKAKDGIDPIWPDGSSMRFLPIKGSSIRNCHRCATMINMW